MGSFFSNRKCVLYSRLISLKYYRYGQLPFTECASNIIVLKYMKKKQKHLQISRTPKYSLK